MTTHHDTTKPAVAVTGTRGFLGSVLADVLSREGYRVVRLSRGEPEPASRFTLGDDVPPSIFQGAEVLIHAAYDFSLTRRHDIRRVNVEGTRRLFNTAIAAGVKKIVFISSASAFAESRQLYGQAKYAAERMARGIGAYVVRPGIIYDETDRGLLPKLALFARLPLVPLFDGGRQPFVLTHARDLATLMLALIRSEERAPRTPITAGHPKTLTFRALLAELASRQGKTPRFVRMPSLPLLLLLRGMEMAGLRPPFRSDSLIGLLSPNPALDFTLTEAYGVPWRPFGTDRS